METISVLLVEDDPMVQQINASFIERVDGFKIVGIAKNGDEALEKIAELRPQLVILDLYMPGKSGLDTLKIIRNQDLDIDVIAVTAANDRETVLKVIRLGALDYVFKPFHFERIQKALLRYRQYYNQRKSEKLSQKVFDYAMNMELPLHVKNEVKETYPKGIQSFTLQQISDCIREIKSGISAEDIGNKIGMSRVTVRRYLEYLEGIGKVKSNMIYGTIGRPTKLYRWFDEQNEQKV